jgi:small-conductance mechanosensitive channel
VRFVVRANSLFFKEIRNENLKIKGFDPDWAIPTSNLVRLLIIAMALVILFPYLPGAESPAVKGIGLFAGLLLSLGSSSAIANAVAGTILTYTRAFRIGDVVQMGESFGTVSDKTLFVTRIRTPKNVTISLPNGSVLGNSITNYSVAARNKSLILHTTVSIGYDTPWRQVEAMLLRAAQRSTHVLQEPRPFVLRKELADFYINYELNTYCDEPDDIPGVYSELHDNILDAFNEFGVQIMSPHYMADRSEKTWVPKDRWFMAPAAPSHPHEQKNSASGQDEARSRQGK